MSLPKLPPSGGTMTVTYGVDRRVKVPMWDEDAMRTYAAAAVRAEREECAKLCEARFMGDMTREDMEARRCAAAIRARNNP